jgi:hypothetical protein
MCELTETNKALDVYLAAQAERDKLWDAIETTEDVYIAERAEKEALEQVQRAFYTDTQTINNLADCMTVPLKSFMRMTGREPRR